MLNQLFNYLIMRNKKSFFTDGISMEEKLKRQDELIMEDKKLGMKYDSGKLRYDLIPPEILEELAKILTHGANKYGDNNWKLLEDPMDRYYAALMRHLQEWRKGNSIDEDDSGELHLSHALANIAFLVYFEKLKK